MLTPETDALWQYLRHQPALKGFVLVGGSALTLRIDHRLSEDLDFVWIGAGLPRTRLDRLIDLASRAGFIFERNDDPAAWSEFEIAGMDLHDAQQDFIVNGKTKVTFFSASSALEKVIASSPEEDCRIAELKELFDSKALVSAARSKTRDWFDLLVLMRDHGFTMDDYFASFDKAGISRNCQTGLDRLTGGVPQLSDEGYETLMPSAPSLGEMTSFFRTRRDAYEIAQSAKARNEGKATGKRPMPD